MNPLQTHLTLDRGQAPTDEAALREQLRRHPWQSRKFIASALGWHERKVPAVAELMTAEIIRGHDGFALIEDLKSADDLKKFKAALDSGAAQKRRWEELLGQWWKSYHALAARLETKTV